MSKQTESTEQPRLFSRAGRPGATVGALPEASDPTTSPAADLLVGRGVPVPAAPVVRPRRLRRTPALRDLVAQTRVAPAQLIAPVFVREGISGPVPIGAMPGVVQHTLDSLRREAAACADAGVGAIDLFGVPVARDEVGSRAWAADGILNRGIAAVREEVGDALVVCADTCLDEFTSHGHCGLVRPEGAGGADSGRSDPRAGEVDNDSTLALYQAMAVSQAEAGAHMVSPSGMMDGQVAAIRAALDATGHDDVAILAYSAKYASAYFGPFREAVGSTLTGDRRAYQQDPANRREGLREAMLDVEQGADMVMVKPAGPYLDVLADVAAASPVPVAAYQVSGEYAMVEAAAANGWIDRDRVMRESVLGIVRAGADCVLTYWARELAEELGR
ncbi:porphobilinogen synthase [Actinomyces sp. oral taxon 448]|uniref:porphobilinogen synthase n=1 Tax=Actinomyces sp. oral taxon 448 TaxID=712124 RepID=UPI00031B43B6|nr:porphobilinogen synthase [Actinomyces sp. oral taxon 448]